jgi:hypothetical protein
METGARAHDAGLGEELGVIVVREIDYQVGHRGLVCGICHFEGTDSNAVSQMLARHA